MRQLLAKLTSLRVRPCLQRAIVDVPMFVCALEPLAEFRRLTLVASELATFQEITPPTNTPNSSAFPRPQNAAAG